MKFSKEFKEYIKEKSKDYNYEIEKQEIDNIFNEFFGDSGIMNHMLSSRIKDLAYQKEKTKEQDNDMDMEK